MSWGFNESGLQSYYPLPTPAGHTGITFVAASGDNGLAGGTDWPACLAECPRGRRDLAGRNNADHVRDGLVRQRRRLQPI